MERKFALVVKSSKKGKGSLGEKFLIESIAILDRYAWKIVSHDIL